MEKISKYISYQEATKSHEAIRRGIDNTPNEKQLAAMIHVGENIFDPIREKVNGPLFLNSFFRSPALNLCIGGAKHSQHCNGEAIDIDADKYGYGNNKMIFYLIRHELEYDQLIWEFGTDDQPDWVHVSLIDEKLPEHIASGRKNRKEVLRAIRTASGETKYLPF